MVEGFTLLRGVAVTGGGFGQGFFQQHFQRVAGQGAVFIGFFGHVDQITDEVVVQLAKHQHVLTHMAELVAQFVVQNGIQNGDIRVCRVLDIVLTELDVGCQGLFQNAAVGFHFAAGQAVGQRFGTGRQFQLGTDCIRNQLILQNAVQRRCQGLFQSTTGFFFG